VTDRMSLHLDLAALAEKITEPTVRATADKLRAALIAIDVAPNDKALAGR
jgi:hypothetical protein